MESLGVISKVDIPTHWCVGMVVVPKPDQCIWLARLIEAEWSTQSFLARRASITAQRGILLKDPRLIIL